jgi:hypothetical protein
MPLVKHFAQAFLELDTWFESTKEKNEQNENSNIGYSGIVRSAYNIDGVSRRSNTVFRPATQQCVRIWRHDKRRDMAQCTGG